MPKTVYFPGEGDYALNLQKQAREEARRALCATRIQTLYVCRCFMCGKKCRTNDFLNKHVALFLLMDERFGIISDLTKMHSYLPLPFERTPKNDMHNHLFSFPCEMDSRDLFQRKHAAAVVV